MPDQAIELTEIVDGQQLREDLTAIAHDKSLDDASRRQAVLVHHRTMQSYDAV